MRKPRSYYQQVAAAVKFEIRLNAKLINVFRRYNKSHFTFKHNVTGKMWTTTLSKLENYGHNKFRGRKKKPTTYWAPKDWEKAGKASSNFDSFKVYIIECTHIKTKELFYKVGRTFNTLDKRFGKDFPYTYTICKIYTGTAQAMCILEEHIHILNKETSYKPKINFSGYSECFTSVSTHDGRLFLKDINTIGLPNRTLKDNNENTK